MPDQMASVSTQNGSWSALLFRLTAFLSPRATVDMTTSWWAEIIGELPESQQSNPKLFQKTEAGSYNGASLSFEIQPGRVDWRISALAANQPIPNSPDDFRPISILLPSFLEITNRWFAIAPPLIRLAFGAQLGIPVSEKASGYRTLARYLPALTIDAEGSSDLLYQINRPRTSSIISDLRINRLSKWAVTIFTTANMRLLGDNPTLASESQQLIACLLELDINTAASHTEEIPPGQLAPQFLELTRLGQEIAATGDLP